MGNQHGNDLAALIVFDQPFYYSGEVVSGSVNFNVNYNHGIRDVAINIVGKETTHWTSKMISSHERGRYEEMYEKKDPLLNNSTLVNHGEKTLFKNYLSLGTLPLNGGQYSFPFRVLLQSNLPSSFEYIDDRFNCSIVYYAECEITKSNNEKYTIYKSFLVRQPNSVFNYNLSMNNSGDISDWCSSKGKASVEAKTTKSNFSWGENASFSVKVDNSNCTLKAESIKLSLTQTLNFKSEGVGYEYLSREICGREEPINCEGNSTKETTITLNLTDLNNPTKNYISKSRNLNYFDNQNDLSSLISSVKGNLISCEYNLNILVKWEGCRCCDAIPPLYFPIIIYPSEFRYNIDMYKPNNWNPQVMNTAGENSNKNNTNSGGMMSGGYDPVTSNSGGMMSGGYDPQANNKGGMMSGGYDPQA